MSTERARPEKHQIEVTASKTEVIYRVNDIKMTLDQIDAFLLKFVSVNLPRKLSKFKKILAMKNRPLTFDSGWIHIHLTD